MIFEAPPEGTYFALFYRVLTISKLRKRNVSSVMKTAKYAVIRQAVLCNGSKMVVKIGVVYYRGFGAG